MHKKYLCFLVSFLSSASVYALSSPPMSFLFPIDHYDQTITDWIKPSSFSDKPLLDPVTQKKQFENFKNHLMLPWNDRYIITLLNSELETSQGNTLKNFDKNYTCIKDKFICFRIPKDKQLMGRGICDAKAVNANMPYPDSWIQDLTIQVNLSQFTGKNSAQGKAIAIDNLNVRALPTDGRYFHDCNLPGEGDSFDYLQTSALWAGTPVYILGESADHRWYLVDSPDVIGWVKSAGIKKVSDEFVAQWMEAVNKDKSLVAINSPINAKTLFIYDEATHTKRFSSYIGAVFPLNPSTKLNETGFHILIPVKEQDLPVSAYLSRDDATLIPWAATPTHFMQVISNLKGRAYGWGSLNIKNPSEFLNDCSQELKSLYTPFGIWLPRHSADQADAKQIMGTVVDFKSYSSEERIAKLMSNGNQHRFTTIIYIGGHIIMYLGSYENPADASGAVVALTYQNMWGLAPVSGVNADGSPFPGGRYVIGKSVLFPLLAQYPEKYPYPVDRELISPANKPFFTVVYLDQLPFSSVTAELWNDLGIHAVRLSLKELHTLMQ